MATSKASKDTIVSLMRANLLGVFNERNPSGRKATIATTYAEDVLFHEPDTSVRGHDEVNRISGEILDKSPGWVFKPDGPVTVSHNLGMLRWGFGPEGEKPVVQGCDIAEIEDGRIKVLHVMIVGPSTVELAWAIF